ncbi:hypothetical protein AYO22_07660 [Fonsecaea multimorphosa]|nr:hypothetical protein AYO22_07660 [Fonsecaea multimorphosa]
MAQIPHTSQVQPQVRGELQPLQVSFERFRATLDPDEQEKFQHTTFQDVISEVESLEKKQAASSHTVKIKSRIQPLLSFLDRYGRALDSLTQAKPIPFSLVWGLVRILLEVASSHSRYLERLIDAVEDITDKVSLYAEYESLLKGDLRFQAALADVYYDTLVFLHKAKTVFSKRGQFVQGSWRTFELDFQKTLRGLSRHKTVLEDEIALSDRTRVVAVWKEARHNVSRWLSPADAQDDFLRESKRRTSPCGQWLLSHELFKEWYHSTQNRILWIVGPPGSGKTVLSTSIIEHVQSERDAKVRQPVAFFYCSQNSQQNQTTVSILAAIIAQIIAQFEDLPEAVLEAYNKSTKCARPRLSMADQPLFLIKSLCDLLNELYIVIDGLDEAEDPDDVMQKMLAITDSSANVRTLILSRELPGLTKRFDPHPIFRITSKDTRADIDVFVADQLSKLDFMDAELHDKMFAKLSQGADGMFLWASLILQSLASATSTYDAMDILSNHPVGLSMTYNAILRRFNTRSPQGQKLTKTFLTWLCCAARPVGWNELRAALAVDKLEEENFRQRIPFKAAMLEICSPLVEYLSDQDVFRFVHISVREFLLTVTETPSVGRDDESQLPFREADGHFHIATVCLRYLLQAAVVEANLGPDSLLFPLSEYATSFWAYHLVRSRYDSELDEMMHSYLSSRPRRLSWIARQLFGESSVFPLQHLVKLQKQLCKWASAGDRERDDRLDWIRDVEQILLDVEHVEEQQRSSGSETDSIGGRARITYFEKLMVIRDLSREYTMSNRLDQGERWMTQALQKKQGSLRPDELSTVWLLNSLGIVYDQQQKVELAAATQEKALMIQEKHLGTSHLETIWTVNELGRMYRHLQRTQDSITMHSRALAVLRTSGDDLQVAWTLNTLARARRQLGDPANAIALHKEAIAIQKKLLGAEHPHVLWATADIGRCYRDQHRFVESARHHRICLEGRKRVLGLDHLDTLWAMNDLGLVMAEFNKVEARKLHRQALVGQTLLLGASHRHTVWSRTQIAKLEAQISLV